MSLYTFGYPRPRDLGRPLWIPLLSNALQFKSARSLLKEKNINEEQCLQHFAGTMSR